MNLKRAFTNIMLAAAFASASVVTAGAEPFEIAVTFDDNSQFTDDSPLPEGWKSEGRPFIRNTSAYFGLPAKSGDYILGRSSLEFKEIIYTPLVHLAAGKPYTIELSFIAPGGNPPAYRNNGFEIGCGTTQTIDTHTVVGTAPAKAYTDWTDFKFTYTPETEGDYCFSIRMIPGQLDSMCGTVAFDDIFITGTTPGPEIPPMEPDPDNEAYCIDLPYNENFSDPTHYTGDSYVPRGWLSVGTEIWRTANVSSLPPRSGDYYLIVPNSSAPHDETAYTAFFNLEAGKEYTLSFYTYIQGNDWNYDDILYTPTLDVTVGTQQDADFHHSLLHIEGYANEQVGWDRRQISFTPEAGGPYCFSFRLGGDAYTGIVAVDDLRLTAPGLIDRVEPSFVVSGLFDLMDSRLTVFGSDPVRMVNKSLYADEYEWRVEGAVPSYSTEAEPTFVFPVSGDYNISLTATNVRGSRTVEKTVRVKVAEKDGSYAVMHYNSSDDRIFDKGLIPAFATSEFDFVTGFNHYYMTVAQRYDFPEDVENELNSMSFWTTDRCWRAMTTALDDQRIKPFAITVYGADSNGYPDSNKVFGSLKSTNGKLLGSSGLGADHGEMTSIAFTEPICTKGTFFVAMEFDKSMCLDAEDVNFGRSYFATGVIRHGSGQTFLYGLSTADGTWKSIDEYDPEMAGLGANWHIWLKAAGGLAGIDAEEIESKEFDVRFDDGILTVAGTCDGDVVSVYNPAGQTVAVKRASAGSTLVDCTSLPQGIYIVTSGRNIGKIIKR